MKLVWRHGATLQLKSQLSYLKNENPFAASRIRKRITQRLNRLKHLPRAGRLSRQLDVRELVIAARHMSRFIR